MHAAGLMPLHTDVGVASHAHPLPARPSSPPCRAQRLFSILKDYKLDVQLEGLAVTENISTCGIFQPQMRSSPATERAISHLDVVSCWKGLSFAQATEIATLLRVFRHGLAVQVKDYLQRAGVEYLMTVEGEINDVTILPLFVEGLTGAPQRTIQVDIARLIQDMLETFYDEYPVATQPQLHSWALGSHNLPKLLYSIVRTQDCFLHTPSGPCISIGAVRWSYTDLVLTIVGNVAWQPPAISFEVVPYRPRYGQQYCIFPRYTSPSLGLESSMFKFEPERILFTVVKGSMASKWDCHRQYFQGIASSAACEDGLTSTDTETIISARITSIFPDNVRFEQTSRYLLRIEASLGMDDDEITEYHAHAPSMSLRTKASSEVSFPALSSSSIQIQDADPNNNHMEHRVCRDSPQDGGDQSPRKRKALVSSTPSPVTSENSTQEEVEIDDFELENKRPRLSCGDSGDLEVPPLGLRTPSTQLEQKPDYGLHARCTKLAQLPQGDEDLEGQLAKRYATFSVQASKTSYFDGLEPWSNWGYSTARPELDVEQISPQISLTHGHRSASDHGLSVPHSVLHSRSSAQFPGLSQHQIQQNYREFEEQAHHKLCISDAHESYDLEQYLLELSEQDSIISEVCSISDAMDSTGSE